MRRREFTSLVGASALAWPLRAIAQASKVARIGIIDNTLVWDNFRQGLRELGHVEGRNIAFEYRYSEGRFDRLGQAAAELVARGAGIAMIAVNVRGAEDFGGAFAAMLRQRPQALMTTNDPLQQSHMAEIIDFLLRNKLPGMFQARENAAAGGLLSYGASLPDLF